MQKPTSASFLAQRRPTRARIEYEVQLYGEPKMLELPFVMGVLSDLSGDAKEPLAPVADRKFLEVDVDNFDARMKAMKPRAAFMVPNTLTGKRNLAVDITFESMDDFSPAAVVRKVDALNQLLQARNEILNLLSGGNSVPANSVAQSHSGDGSVTSPVRHPSSPTHGTDAGHVAASSDDSDFLMLLGKQSTSDYPTRFPESASPFAEPVISLAGSVQASPAELLEIIKCIDQNLTEQISRILHHERFQRLESAWRGLHYLVTNNETDEMLKIRVMNISKGDLAKTLKRYDGVTWDQSPLFKKLYDEEYGQLGGAPYGCLVGDYYFDHSPADVASLASMARMAAHCHAPFLAGAAPSLMGMESWEELANPKDIARIFSTPEYAAWRSLRDTDEARYVGLAMPRFLARLPYGARTSPVEEFEFEEETGGGDHHRYTWANAAYAMAVNIGRAFKLYGWCTQIQGIESGGLVEGLPVHTFPSNEDGVDHSVGPIEITISERQEKPLADCGFMPLLHRKNSDEAAFIGAQSLQKPTEYTTDDASANAKLAARLPQVFAVSRFAQYLLCMNRDRIGTFKERADVEQWMNDWLQQYVLADPDQKSDVDRAARPLRRALVTVNKVAGRPELCFARLEIRPGYPLDGKLTAYLLIR